MAIALDSSAVDTRIRMPDSVTVNSITELHRQFLEALRAKQSIEIDFDQTTELDASAVQLLYRVCQSAGSADLTITVAGTLPDLVQKTFRDAGLDPFQRALQALGQ